MWQRLTVLKRRVRIRAAYLLVLGPWNALIVRLLQRYWKNTPAPVNHEPILEKFDSAALVTSLKEHGFAAGLRLQQHVVDEILREFSQGAVPSANPHLHCRGVSNIAYNVSVLEIARRYLGIEPIVHSSRLSRALPDPVGQPDRPFHFDVSDFKSVVLFIYLTDISNEAGPHCIIEGTHKKKGVLEIFRRLLDEKQAVLRFGDRALFILGPCGTAFFEDETIYHRRMVTKKERLILNINYVMVRPAAR